jgi:hypothetical protein
MIDSGSDGRGKERGPEHSGVLGGGGGSKITQETIGCN